MAKHREIEVEKRYGSLTVLKKLQSKKYRYGKLLTCISRWECLCDCGNTHITYGSHLNRGVVHQCKECRYKNMSLKIRQTSSDEEYLYKRFLIQADKRNKECTLSQKDFAELIYRNCHYCNSEPTLTDFRKNKLVSKMTIKSNGIDRKDNSIGYIKSNCVPCCGTCNYMKYTTNHREFLNHIVKIYMTGCQRDE